MSAVDEVTELSRRIRLPYLRGELADVLVTAKAQRWEPAEVLRVLLVAEVQGRNHSMIESRRRKARLPSGKTFDSFDESRSSIPGAVVRGLRTLEWIEHHENLVVCGPSGTGKSHFLEALGHQAIDEGKVVAWCSVEELGGLVRSHRVDDTVPGAIRPLLRADLVIVDDVGLLPLSPDAAEGLFRLVDGAYEQRSIALEPVCDRDAVACHQGGWGAVAPDLWSRLWSYSPEVNSVESPAALSRTRCILVDLAIEFSTESELV